MKRKLHLVLMVFCLAIILGVVYFYCISLFLVTTFYSIEEPVTSSIRMVHLTDLHNAEFGEENCELIERVAEQNPDLIVMTGDMINRDNEDLSVITNLISQLSEFAPVYFGYGNHEYSWEEEWKTSLKEPLSSAGAVVLNNEYADIEVNGQSIRIGGYMGYYRQPHMFPVSEEQRALELAFADEFEDMDRLKILLNHIPTQWVDWDYIDEYPVDVVLSGHYHGGVVRIPLIDRGLYVPYTGWFAKNTKGVFRGTRATCILSAGLGSEHFVPRMNNPPEIVVVDLVPTE